MTDFYARAKTLAYYIIETKSTIRKTAKQFGMTKSTVHYDLSYRLKKIDPGLYLQVKEILNYNFNDKHNRGGEATRKMYENIKKNKLCK